MIDTPHVSLLYRTRPTNEDTSTSVCPLVIAARAIACWVPVRRASVMDPIFRPSAVTQIRRIRAIERWPKGPIHRVGNAVLIDCPLLHFW